MHSALSALDSMDTQHSVPLTLQALSAEYSRHESPDTAQRVHIYRVRVIGETGFTASL